MDRVNWQSLETTEHLTVTPHPCFRSQPSFKPGGDPPACLSAKHSSKCTEISFGKKVINSLGSWANICKARQDPHSSKTDLKLRGFLGECKHIICVSVLSCALSQWCVFLTTTIRRCWAMRVQPLWSLGTLILHGSFEGLALLYSKQASATAFCTAVFQAWERYSRNSRTFVRRWRSQVYIGLIGMWRYYVPVPLFYFMNGQPSFPEAMGDVWTDRTQGQMWVSRLLD